MEHPKGPSARPGWTGLESTWSSGLCPYPIAVGRIIWSLRPLPIQTMRRFYDSTISQHPEHLLGPKWAVHVWLWKGNFSHTQGKYSLQLAVYLRHFWKVFFLQLYPGLWHRHPTTPWRGCTLGIETQGGKVTWLGAPEESMAGCGVIPNFPVPWLEWGDGFCVSLPHETAPFHQEKNVKYEDTLQTNIVMGSSARKAV